MIGCSLAEYAQSSLCTQLDICTQLVGKAEAFNSFSMCIKQILCTSSLSNDTLSSLKPVMSDRLAPSPHRGYSVTSILIKCDVASLYPSGNCVEQVESTVNYKELSTKPVVVGSALSVETCIEPAWQA